MRPVRLLSLFAVAACAVLATGFRPTPFLTGDEVMQKVKTTLGADSEVDLVKMVTMSSTGEVETRQLVSAVQKDAKGNFNYVLRFLAPDDVKGTALLVLEKDNGDVQQFLFLPGLGQIKPIQGDGRAGYFMGSDFTFEDLRKEKPNEWKYDRLQDEKVEGADSYVILSAPIDKNREKITGYTNRILYVDKATFIIRRIEFFNAKNERLKIFDAYDYKSTDKEPLRPTRGVMTNNVKKTTTIMSLVNSRVNKPLDPSFFTQDSITKWGPAQDKMVQDVLPAAGAAATPATSAK